MVVGSRGWFLAMEGQDCMGRRLSREKFSKIPDWAAYRAYGAFWELQHVYLLCREVDGLAPCHNLFDTSIKVSSCFKAWPLSRHHRAFLTPSFHRMPPGPLSLITSPTSQISVSQTPLIVRKAPVFKRTNSRSGWLEGSSLRKIFINISAFSPGNLPPDTSERG